MAGLRFGGVPCSSAKLSSRGKPVVENVYSGEGPRAILQSRTGGYAHFQDALAWGADGNTLHLCCRIHENHGQFETVGYLKSSDGGRTWQRLGGQTVPNWLPNIERATGHNTVPDPPGVIYTGGTAGKNNKQIVSNDVFWTK